MFIVVSSKKEWISKRKNNKLIYTDTLVIKLIEVEPLVCQREHNLSETFIDLLVLYFDLNLRAMLEFFRIYARLKIKKEQKKIFQDPRQRTPMGTFHFKGERSTIHK